MKSGGPPTFIPGGLTVGSLGFIAPGASAADAFFVREGPNIIAQRNGVNPQVFRVYNTFTDDDNSERAIFQWSGNICRVGTTRLGTGIARDMQIIVGNVDTWLFTTPGHLLASIHNLVDIGSTGTSSPRSLFLGTSLQIEANNGLKLTNQTSGAAAALGTLTNAPVAGPPAFWARIVINGTNRLFPCW